MESTADAREGGRICLASPWFVPLTGGGQTRYRRYLPGLVERGARLEIFSGTPKPKKVRDLDDDRWRKTWIGRRMAHDPIDGVPVRWFRLPNGTPLRFAVFGYLLWRRCLEPDAPSVVQWMGEINPPHARWLARIRETGVRLVYTSMMAPDDHMMGRDRTGYAHLFSLFDDVIANSSAAADGLRELGMRELGMRAPIEVIPNGVDDARYRPARDAHERSALRHAIGFAEQDRLIVAVGAVSDRKGSDVLTDAWIQLARADSRLRLLFLGRNDLRDAEKDSFSHRLLTRARDAGIADRLHFKGYVENVHEHMRCADVLVLASRLEGLPNSILEAYASGLPVITTPYRGISPEIGEAERHYALADRDPAELAKRIREAFDEPAIAAKRAERALKELVPGLGYPTILDRHVDLYTAWSDGRAREDRGGS